LQSISKGFPDLHKLGFFKKGVCDPEARKIGEMLILGEMLDHGERIYLISLLYRSFVAARGYGPYTFRLRFS